MRLLTVTETTEDAPVNWKNLEPKNTEDKYTWALKQELAARQQMRVFKTKMGPYEKHMITSWNPDKFPTPVSHSIKFNHRWLGIPKGTPKAEEMWKAVQFFVGRFERAKRPRR